VVVVVVGVGAPAADAWVAGGGAPAVDAWLLVMR